MIAPQVSLSGITPAASRDMAREMLNGTYADRVRPYSALIRAVVDLQGCTPLEAAVGLIQAGHDGFSSLLLMAAVAELAEPMSPAAEERRYA